MMYCIMQTLCKIIYMLLSWYLWHLMWHFIFLLLTVVCWAETEHLGNFVVVFEFYLRQSRHWTVPAGCGLVSGKVVVAVKQQKHKEIIQYNTKEILMRKKCYSLCLKLAISMTIILRQQLNMPYSKCSYSYYNDCTVCKTCTLKL